MPEQAKDIEELKKADHTRSSRIEPLEEVGTMHYLYGLTTKLNEVIHVINAMREAGAVEAEKGWMDLSPDPSGNDNGPNCPCEVAGKRVPECEAHSQKPDTTAEGWEERLAGLKIMARRDDKNDNQKALLMQMSFDAVLPTLILFIRRELASARLAGAESIVKAVEAMSDDWDKYTIKGAARRALQALIQSETKEI